MLDYREYINYVEIAITKDKKLQNELTNAAVDLFEKLPTYFKKDDREIKVYRNEENTGLYIFEKNKNRINVFLNNIEYFEADKSLDDLMKYPKMSVNENKPIYTYKLLSSPIGEKETITNNVLFAKMEELGTEAKAQIASFKELFKNELKEDPYFLANLKGKAFTSTSSLSDLKNLVTVFKNENCVENIYSDDIFKSLSKDLLPEVKKGLPKFIEKLEILHQTSMTNNFSQTNQFEFNDLDNHVWLHNGKLIITDQNCGFYVDMKDKNNFSIYFLEKEYKATDEEIARVEDCISKNKINTIDSTILEVKDGSIQFADNQLLYVLELDTHFSIEAMKEEGLIKKSVKKKI